MPWAQNYNPFGHALLSTLVAAIPIAALLISIAYLQIRVHLAALLGLGLALLLAVAVYHMPVTAAAGAALFGVGSGLLPIGWIILNLIFLYQLTVKKGLFETLRRSLQTLAPDPRIQLILIAFSFGAFFEGAAGFGTPVAITSAILMQLGFKPLAACGLSLIANTAPVAYGALGTPVIMLSTVTGLDLHQLSAMAGRQLPFFSLVIPFWVVAAMAGFRATWEVWPAALTAGVSFAVPQFLVSNFHGPWLVDIVAAVCSMLALMLLLKFWRPKTSWTFATPVEPAAASSRVDQGPASDALPPGSGAPVPSAPRRIEMEPAPPAAHGALDPPLPSIGGSLPIPRREVMRAWLPWILLSAFVFVWGLPPVKQFFNGLSNPKFPVTGLHRLVVRTPPIVPAPAPDKPTAPEEAIYKFEWLSATGTGIFFAALLAGLIMGYPFGELFRIYFWTLWHVRLSLLTIAAMLGLGYVTKYSGMDVTLGLALAKTGRFYPFFGTLLGWLGVALTGSDTASNVLFGSLQKITAIQTGISPVLMAAANTTGGVMGKMIDAQSIVVASTATNWYGHEGDILRYVFFHSLSLAALVACLVYLQAYVAPFTALVPH